MKMRRQYLSRRRRQSARKAKAQTDAQIGNSGTGNRPGEPGNWVPWKRIGSGGQGSAWIWIYFNQNNAIIRRVVKKDTHCKDSWYDIRAWAGNDLKDYNSRIPWEHRCQSQLTWIANARHVVRTTMQWSPILVSEAWKSHKIYTEWCPMGDLADLITKYKEQPAPNNYIAEPMIWATAEALALAGLAMQHGTEDVDAGTLANWIPIIHRDLKPGNIFLADPSPNAQGTTLWPSYPKPLLGDFGLAIETSPTDPHNPTWHLELGTPGYMAPEQLAYIDRTTLFHLNPTPLTEKTNVFGIGVILYSLLTLNHGAASGIQPEFLGVNPQDQNPFTLQDDEGDPYDQNNADKYTESLRGLIDECTHYDPALRPDFREILRRTRGLFDGPGDGLGVGASAQDLEAQADVFMSRGMRGGWAGATTRARYCLKNGDGSEWRKGDVYTVGLNRAALQAVVPQAL
ncbi:putative serine/threonine-protein kinase nek2 [Fulvia fulva]|nr:putative serine/threonine-protein kinase nek2 [Fulvia fulva]